MVVRRPSAACRRRRWWVRSIQVTIAMRSSSRMVPTRRSRTFFCSRLKKDSMAALSPAAPTLPRRSGHPVPFERPDELPWSKLRSAIGAQDAAVDVFAPGRGVVQGSHGRTGLHPRVDGVAHDPVAEDIPDRAEVQLAGPGGVFGDVGAPQPGSGRSRSSHDGRDRRASTGRPSCPGRVSCRTRSTSGCPGRSATRSGPPWRSRCCGLQRPGTGGRPPGPRGERRRARSRDTPGRGRRHPPACRASGSTAVWQA